MDIKMLTAEKHGHQETIISPLRSRVRTGSPLASEPGRKKRSKQKLRVKYADLGINLLVSTVLRNKMSPPAQKEIGNAGFKQTKG